MTRSLSALCLSFVILLAAAGAAVALQFSQWIVLPLLGLSLATALIMIAAWMKIVRKLVVQSLSTLNKQEQVSAWSFGNIELLSENQKAIDSKFQLSAELISNLSGAESSAVSAKIDANDPIAKAVSSIRAEMQRVKDEEDKRNWVTQGLARFGEVLRNKLEINEYGNAIISNLVKYLGVNQGGLYIEVKDEDGDRCLDLVASYAYGKRKFVDSRVRLGQGILGQCMLERDFTFITDVPKDYVKITSGLGEALPRNVIIAPLIFNEVFCGAIELASFEILEPHKLQFLKEVCENIASEIVAIKNIEHTQTLLRESNTLTNELQNRESELKQHLDEIASTQQAMARKQAELSGIINAIDSTLATAEFNMEGKLIKYNSILQKFFGYSDQQFYLRDYSFLVGTYSEVSWKSIVGGQTKSGDFKTRHSSGSELWLSVTFTSVHDDQQRPDRVLCMIQDITERKNREQEFERLSLVANNTDNSVIITDKNGFTEYVNEGFTKMTGYEASQIIGKKPGTLLQGPLTDKTIVDKLRKKIAQGTSVYEEILNYNSKGETYWVSLAINPVHDESGGIVRFISIQADITQTKIKALDVNQKMEALSRSNAIIEMNCDGTIIDINDNYLQMLGYSRNEIVGRSYNLLARKETVFPKLMQTIVDQGMQSGVYPRVDREGNRHYMKLMDYPVLDLEGKIQKIIEFGVDVSNEKRLEKEAERKQAELNSYLDGINNTIASAEFTLSGEFKRANEIFLKVLGYSEETLAKRNYDFFMGDDPSVIMMWENLRLGKFFSGEFKIRDHSGKELWLAGTFNPIMVEGDIPEKIMMFAQFTTQEKEKLNDLNGMVSALKSTLPVIELNPDFTCKTANEKALKLLDIPRLQLRSKTMVDFIAPYYHASWLNMQQDLVKEDFHSIQIPVIAGGQVIPFQTSLSINRNLDGKINKIILILVREVDQHVSILAAV